MAGSILSNNFSYIGDKPNFDRDTISTKEDMLNVIPQNKEYDYGHIVFCKEDGKHYKFIYNYDNPSSNKEKDDETGWFELIPDLRDANTEHESRLDAEQELRSAIASNRAERIKADEAITAELEKKVEASDTALEVNSIEETLVTNALRKTAQILTDAEKQQVQKNIGVDVIQQQLQGNISTVQQAQSQSATSLRMAITDEANRATAAEKALGNRIDNIQPVEFTGTVVNAPDEEDITQVDNALKLKDRAWGDGMGYVILRKNKPLQEQLTEENTIYEVRYDFDLNGEEITMPLNSVLKFVGGKFSNGAICGGNVFISAIDQLGIFNNCILKGNFKADIAYSYWFNISKVEDNTSILNSLLNIIATRVEFAKYDFPIVVSVNSDKTSSIVLSIGNKEIDFNYNVIKMSPNNYEKYNCIEIKAENLSIKNLIQIGDIENHTGDAGEWGHGICLRHCKNIIVDNCTFSYNWGDGIDLIDTYYGDACPENIKILNTKCLYNRRQGISVEAVKTLHVENCEFAETGRVKATAPSSGIDIEPWQNTDNSRIKDVIIKSCRIYNNVGQNIQIQCNTRFEDKDYTNDIRLENNTIYDDYKDEVIVLKDIVNLKILGNFLGNDNHYFSITLFQNKNIQILNNIIKGNVYIQASNKATITYNHIFSERAFEEISPWGHLSPLNCVDCNNFIVSNNDFKSLKYAGIKCTTATENTIYSNRISGIETIEVSGQITLFSNIIDTNHIHLIKENCLIHSKDNIITNKGISEFCVIIDCYERVDDKYSYTSINDVFHGYTYCFGFYRPGGRVYMENLQNIKAEIYGGYEDYWDFRNVTIEFESHITSTVNGKNRFDFDGQPIGTARYGDIIHRPSLSKVNHGLIYNDWDIYRPIFNINGKWRTADGIIAPDEPYNPVERTVSRPKSLDENNKGLQFFDIDLSKPIWWTGTKWIDAIGTEV